MAPVPKAPDGYIQPTRAIWELRKKLGLPKFAPMSRPPTPHVGRSPSARRDTSKSSSPPTPGQLGRELDGDPKDPNSYRSLGQTFFGDQERADRKKRRDAERAAAQAPLPRKSASASPAPQSQGSPSPGLQSRASQSPGPQAGRSPSQQASSRDNSLIPYAPWQDDNKLRLVYFQNIYNCFKKEKTRQVNLKSGMTDEEILDKVYEARENKQLGPSASQKAARRRQWIQDNPTLAKGKKPEVCGLLAEKKAQDKIDEENAFEAAKRIACGRYQINLAPEKMAAMPIKMEAIPPAQLHNTLGRIDPAGSEKTSLPRGRPQSRGATPDPFHGDFSDMSISNSPAAAHSPAPSPPVTGSVPRRNTNTIVLRTPTPPKKVGERRRRENDSPPDQSTAQDPKGKGKRTKT